jgi:2,4-dienoyl-CoA reductase-like NADH-dependent reductase (Old Yellow Enzyme family)
VNQKEDESYFHGFASRLRKEIEIPVILVGGNRSLDVMDRLYQEEGIDMFSMSRALTCEPELIQRWQSGDTEDGHCRYCNACLKTHAHQCVFNLKNNERAQL